MVYLWSTFGPQSGPRRGGVEVLYLLGSIESDEGALVLAGHLTREHRAAVYGLPVLLDQGGQVLDPGEVRAILVPPELTEGERQLLEGAYLAGFELLPA